MSAFPSCFRRDLNKLSADQIESRGETAFLQRTRAAKGFGVNWNRVDPFGLVD